MKPVVVHLIDSFHQGGSERQALQLTRLLYQSDRYAVRLASIIPEGSLRASVADLDLGEIPSFPLNSFYDLNAVKQLNRFVSWLKRSRADILHTHDFYTNVFGMSGATLARIPAKVASMRETAGMRTAAQKKTQRVAYSLANAIVGNSNAVRDKLIADGIQPAKIAVIYNGLDMARLETSLSREHVLKLLRVEQEDARFVSIVANMRHEVKDYPMFLRAAKAIKAAVPQAGFLLAGEGELEDSLKSLASDLGIAGCTFFLGRCDKVAELLSVSDVCVLSSKAEGFSNSIIEYMAAGRPVVATDVGGAREAIVEGETGFLVPSGDYGQLAERVITLLKEPERARQMGDNGKQIARLKFSCEEQLRQTESLYERLLR